MSKPIKAMILAAGKGTRVKPLTRDLPKPMIPILGKPVMEYLIEHLARSGIKDVMVNVAYQHWKIEGYFGTGSRWGVNIGYSYEGAYENGEIIDAPKGSAGGMRQIQDFGGFFDTTTLVICGDALIDLDIKQAVAKHRERGALATVVTLEVAEKDVKNYGIVETDSNHKVISFQEKPRPEEARSRLASTGIYIFEPEVLDLIPKDTVFDIGSQLFPMLVEKGLPFYAQETPFEWIDIGQLSDYWSVSQRVLSGEVKQMTMPGKQVRPNVWLGLNARVNWDKVNIVGPVYIGSGVCIEDDVEIIGPTWISRGSRICSGAKIVRSILLDYTRISKNMLFHETIVSPQYCVDHATGQTYYFGDDHTELRWGDARRA